MNRLAVLLALVLALVGCADQAGVPGMLQAANRPFPPYRVIDNIYYVGTNGIAQFLIVTERGNILLDTGFEASLPRLRENIESLGFHYRDVELVLTSHAHIDHVQAHARVRRETGAAIVASSADAPFIEHGGKGEPAFDGELSWTPSPVDRRVNDGDTVTLGATTLTAHLTPGHTPGATTWTMKVHDGGKALDVLFFPSATVLPDVPLRNNARYPRIAADFARSFAIWKALPCDVFLADHGEFYGMIDKHDRLVDGASPNPFIDPRGYRDYLAVAERRYLDRLESER